MPSQRRRQAVDAALCQSSSTTGRLCKADSNSPRRVHSPWDRTPPNNYSLTIPVVATESADSNALIRSRSCGVPGLAGRTSSQTEVSRMKRLLLIPKPHWLISGQVKFYLTHRPAQLLDARESYGLTQSSLDGLSDATSTQNLARFFQRVIVNHNCTSHRYTYVICIIYTYLTFIQEASDARLGCRR